MLFSVLFLFSALNVSGQTKESGELFPVCEKGKCGYIDGTGQIAIPLRFNSAYDFSEGLARVVVGDKFGFIEKSGKIVIHPQFGLAFDFTEGLAPAPSELLISRLPDEFTCLVNVAMFRRLVLNAMWVNRLLIPENHHLIRSKTRCHL